MLKKSKITLQYDLEGNFIKEWKTITLAAKEVRGKLKGISKNLNGESHKAYGFQWKFKEENYPIKISALDEILDYGKRINIIQYSLDGDFIKVFPSATKAAIELNSIPNIISRAVKLQGISCGFQWRVFTNDYPLKIEKSFVSKKVKCSSNQETLIFNSLKEASDKFNVSYVTIRNWCKINANKEGYVWFFN